MSDIPKITAQLKLKGFATHLEYTLSHRCPNCLVDVGEKCVGLDHGKEKELKTPHNRRSQIGIWHRERDVQRAIRDFGSLSAYQKSGKDYSTVLWHQPGARR